MANVNTIDLKAQKHNSGKANFFTFESLLTAGIIQSCPDMEVLQDYKEYLSEPHKYDWIYPREPSKWLFNTNSKYEEQLAKYKKVTRIKESYEKVKKWGGLLYIWDKAYIFKTQSIGENLQEEFLWDANYMIDEDRFNEMLVWMNQAKIRQSLKIEALVHQTNQNVDDVMGILNAITVYSLTTLMADSWTPIGGSEQTQSWSIVSGEGWEFSGGWATWDTGSATSETNTGSSWNE